MKKKCINDQIQTSQLSITQILYQSQTPYIKFQLEKNQVFLSKKNHLIYLQIKMLRFVLTPKYLMSTLASSYKVLGVDKSCSTAQIKKRYYELAKQYHPDVNKSDSSHQKFAQITKAYNFIVQNKDNPEHQQESGPFTKRHNPYATNSQKRTKTPFEEDWEQYSTYDEYYRSYKKYKKAKRGQDIYINLTISLRESFAGAKKKVQFTRKVNCPSCSEQQPMNCISCGGKGEIFHRKNKQKMQCPNCDGLGYKLQCQQCNGTRFVNKDVEEQIYVQKGTHDKSILRVKNNGHQGFKHHNGDLYVTVMIEQSQKMKIDGNNIHSEIELEYLTAVFGGQIEIETIQGLKKVQIPPGTQSGHEMRLFNFGIKSAYSTRVGDHVLKFKIKIPKKLSSHQKKLMSQLSLQQVVQNC